MADIRTLDVRISNEDEAWAYLEQALDGQISEDTLAFIDFDGWPHININLPATPTNGSISPSTMEAFIELQKTIYRAHTFLSSDTGDLRTLSKAERDSIEFRVKVTSGSSKYDIDLTKILETLGTDVVTKMTSTHLMITILSIALILGSVVAFKAWLASRTEQRKAELEDADKRRWLENYQAQLQHDTSRFERLAQAIERQPVLGEIEAAAETARQQLVRAIGDERGGAIQGIALDAEFASEVVAQKRQQGSQVRLAGNYRVAKVDATNADGFKVTLVDLRNGEEVVSSLQDALLSEDHRRLIAEAEWKKRPLYVEMTARRLRNRVVDAVIVNVGDTSGLAVVE